MPSGFRLCTMLACLLAPGIIRADGLLIIPNPPRPLPGHFAFAPLEVVYHHVSVSIDNNVAVTEVDQAFYNPSGARLEGEYVFPLPEGAAIDKFSMDVDGKMLEAELLPADKARAMYEEIVRKQRDPALLEYTGRGALRARIFPIEPNSKKRVKLRYTQVLTPDSGLSEYVYPLNTEKFSARPLKEVSIKIELRCDQPLKSIYSPSHDVEIRHHDDRSATIGFEAKDARPDTDFKLIYGSDQASVGMSILTYRPSKHEDGYFMVLASPGVSKDKAAVKPRDVCFVLDTSGSMAGGKMEQAKKALKFCLANLNEGDRFQIVRFSTEAEALFPDMREANAANIDEANSFVDKLKPIGGTAIHDALQTALESHADGHRRGSDSRSRVIIFLTDGQPTVGPSDEDELVKLVKDKYDDRTRIFAFGIGSDVNTHLLDRIANNTRAFSQYVLEKEDIEVKVSSFYSKIQSPVLMDLKLSFGNRELRADNVQLKQIYPAELPDLYMGQTLVTFGRYSGQGTGKVLLTGDTQTLSTPADFPEKDDTHAFIARLWATRRVGWLLDEIRMRGESSELKDEVVTLARDHGIVTPYTAFLILEDEARRNVPLTMRSYRELETNDEALHRTRGYYDSARAGDRLEKAGERAVSNAQSTAALKQGASEAQAQQDLGLDKSPTIAGQPLAATTAPEEALGYRVQQSFAQQVRNVRGKTFYQNGATWTDAAAQVQATTQPGRKQQKIEFNSAEYFALVRDHPDAAAWLSVGNEVDVVIDQTLYQIR